MGTGCDVRGNGLLANVSHKTVEVSYKIRKALYADRFVIYRWKSMDQVLLCLHLLALFLSCRGCYNHSFNDH